MKIGLASDHAGYGLKTMISTYLSGMGLRLKITVLTAKRVAIIRTSLTDWLAP